MDDVLDGRLAPRIRIFIPLDGLGEGLGVWMDRIVESLVDESLTPSWPWVLSPHA